jgi:hypothetical protein
MSSAALRLVPSDSMKVVGCAVNSSVSLAAIQMKRGDNNCLLASRPALTKCQRITESAVAQPTQEPVERWSLIAHHFSLRSFDAGIGVTATMPAAMALSKRQSFWVSGEGMQLRMRIPDGVTALVSCRFADRVARGDGRRRAGLLALRAIDLPLRVSCPF